MEPRWRGSLQVAIGLALTFLFLYMMAPFIVPMLFGAVIAIIVHPVYDVLIRKTKKSLAAITVTLGVLVGILLPIFFVIYSASYRLLGVISRMKIPSSTDADERMMGFAWYRNLINTVHEYFPVDREWIRNQSFEVLQTILEKLSKFVAATLAGMPGIILGFVVVLLSLYFFLVDGAVFLKFLSRLSPMKEDKSRELYLTFERTCRGVVLGLLASGGVQGILSFIFYWACGVPNPGMLAMITAVLSLVPLFGSTPITIGAAIYLFAVNNIGGGIGMSIGVAVVGLSDNIVRPWVMKGSAEMHPFLALVSVFGALNLLGAPGIFLGPVIAAVFVAFMKMMSPEQRDVAGSSLLS